MSYKSRKQFFYGIIYLVIFGLIGAGIYFALTSKEATCFDGIQNQNEEGVDCGGPCQSSCEHLTIRDIEVKKVNLIPAGNLTYDLAAQIENPNPNFGLSDLDYSFRMYDAAGELVKEQKGSEFILPGETKYLVEANIQTQKPVSRAEIILKKPENSKWKKFGAVSNSNLFIKDKKINFLENSFNGWEATGVLKNNGDFSFEEIFVSVILFIAAGDPIAAGKTLLNTVNKGEERYFSIRWTERAGLNINSMEMRAETNLLSNENFLRQSGETEKFQEY